MNDMSAVIVPKSDQLNSDDLIAGPMTITITGVDIRPGTEQPVSIHFEGDNKKPWKPCKSMARVMVAAWGSDAKQYTGRSVTLYRDPTVKWGGMDVGGIRVSHMTHMEKDLVMALTMTKGKRAPFTVRKMPSPMSPVGASAAQFVESDVDRAAGWADGYIASVNSADTLESCAAIVEARATRLAELKTKRPELHLRCEAAVRGRVAALQPSAEPSGRTDEPVDPKGTF